MAEIAEVIDHEDTTYDVREAGFAVIALADVYKDGVLVARDLPLREVRPLSKEKLIEYAAVEYPQQWDEFRERYTAALVEQDGG